jgi:hypothetical protein
MIFSVPDPALSLIWILIRILIWHTVLSETSARPALSHANIHCHSNLQKLILRKYKLTFGAAAFAGTFERLL